MKKLYFLFILITLLNCNSLFAQYCTTGIPTQNSEDEIFNINIVGTSLNQNSDCSTTLPAPSVQWIYSDYTSATHILPIGTYTLSLTRGPDCNGAHASSAGAVVFIDWNQDLDWLDANERVLVFPNSINQSNTVTGTFTVPSNAAVGTTRMRVMMGENMAGATQNPCTNYTWGETEDYKIFVGAKKWDYSISSMIAPDSISFCADQPQSPEVTFRNVENQPINGGRVDLYITDPSNPITGTNIFASKAFTGTVMPNTNSSVVFNPIVFPKDELLQFMYVIYHPLDSIKGNDTLVRMVQIYKKPEFSLKADTVCFGDALNKVIIFNQTKPLFQKWANESIVDTTYFKVPKFDFTTNQPYKFGIQVTRGWKCNVDTFVNLMVYEPAEANIKGDTKYKTGEVDTIILCKGQTGSLYNTVIKTGYTFKWDDNLSSTTFKIDVNDTATRLYELAVTTKDQCKKRDTFVVKIASPLPMTTIKDTVCLGETATIGLTNSNPILYLYNWNNNWGTEPVFNPIPTAVGNITYKCKWNYEGCIGEDSVSVLVHPLPNVVTTTPNPICPFFSATILASGANTYVWKNGFGSTPSITVSPLTSTIYTVKGTDNNQCSKEVSYKLFVYPRTDVIVYSNKFQNNVCLGDSATVYVNGAKNYIWAQGSTDSIISLVPQSSFQWSVIGTDGNGCKDTALFGMTVKPAFKPIFYDTVRGCEGDERWLTVTGGKKYNWGSYGTDSTIKIILAKTTSYLVTVTSPEDCQMIQPVPVTVLKAPIAQVSDLTICKGETGKLEAKGGSTYTWSTSGNTTAIEAISLSASQDVTVTVSNDVGCSSTATTSVKVIDPALVPVVFKSPLDSYICPSARIPITMTATPTGGVWSGTGVDGYKLTIPESVSGAIQINYEFFEPVNGCKVSRVKNVNIIRKCNSSINGFDEENGWSVYPNPFTNQLKLKVESLKSEPATINLYDVAGRLVISKEYKLTMGENTLELNSLQLIRGTYYIELQTESVSRQAKILAE